jgi:hypothetical protein
MTHEKEKAQYEEDRKNYERPWELWELQDFRGEWVTCADSPKFARLAHYRRKKPPLRPEYFSGLNWREAEKYVGKLMEFSDSGNKWVTATLSKIITERDEIFRYASNAGFRATYCRTCPETFQDPHPTIRITVSGKDYDLPKPEKEAPEYNTLFYVFCPGAKDMFLETVWRGTDSDHRRLRQGSVFLTEDRAQAWTNWWKEIHK